MVYLDTTQLMKNTRLLNAILDWLDYHEQAKQDVIDFINNNNYKDVDISQLENQD